MVTTIMALTIWTIIYSQESTVLGYERDQMIGYIFLVSLIQGAVMATSLHGLADEIYSGRISHLLMKPVSVLRYLAVQDLADKLKNVVFIVIETIVLYLLFRPSFALPTAPHLLLFGSWIVLAIILHFWMEILFGTLGFNNPQTWGPKFIFFMLIEATAGKLFPVDLLPETFQRIIYLTPFPYLSYFQTQLFLGRLSGAEILQSSFILILWCVLLGAVSMKIWTQGWRDYSAAGS
jgi:ABC-2 type transport system permease protein